MYPPNKNGIISIPFNTLKIDIEIAPAKPIDNAILINLLFILPNVILSI